MSDKIRWRDAKALREENERLREALFKIASGETSCFHSDPNLNCSQVAFSGIREASGNGG